MCWCRWRSLLLAAWLHVTYLCLSCSVCAQEAPSADAAFRLMVANEEIIESLTPAINRLASAVRDLQLPGHYASQFFAPTATALDLAGPDRSAPEPPKRPDVTEHDWLIQEREIPVADLWTALWEEAFLFDDARFGVLKGAADVDGTFVTTLKFSARGRTGTGNSAAWSGEVDVRWSKSSANEWLVQQWVTRKLKTTQTAMRFFREVLDDAIPDSREVARARASVHERYVREVLLTGGTKFTYPKAYWPYVISWDSLDQHPSVSVVDIDGDGWDDFYVTGRWGKNQLWRNRGNGTFEDIAPQIGLNIDGICNCSLFADYDNDGDADVLIGRSLDRSRYYENIGGQFFDKSQESVSSPLPYWVSSMASADVNGDGLLDVYISTYRLPITKPPNVLADEFLNPDEREEWKRRRAEDHPVFRLTGPPNVLLINQGGGRFAPSPQAGGADLWLSTFQSTWSDFDNDGDPDLFVANDYAPDYVFRNDDGKLTDVTTSLAGDVLQGFGMGVSLGDIDNDGFQDPFFTYMYSKAGSRITEMIDGLEPRMYAGVAGNLLLHNTGDLLVKSSASMDVAKTGWSWGGQFADFNNDTFLDLYVANGLYTPPAETATEVDL